MTKVFNSTFDIEELTDTQRDIIECAIENPELTYSEIASEVGCSQEYVGEIHREYIEEEINPNSISWEDVDDEIYESIVAGLESMDEVDRVEQKYDLELSEGDSKEVDVAVWKELQHHDILIIVECKFHDRPIEQEIVSGMVRNQQNSRANHTVLVSKSGFQQGAISQARDAGVDLYTVKKLEEDDADGFIQTIKLDVRLQDSGITPTEIQLSPIGYVPEEKISKQVLNQDPYLWDEDYSHLGIRLNEFVRELAEDKDPGRYQEVVENRAIFANGDFYRIDYIEFEKEDSEEQVAYQDEIDLFEDNDIVMIDVLEDDEDDRNFYALDDILNEFVTTVRTNS